MLDHIITGDETWVLHFTQQKKKNGKGSDEPAPVKFKATLSANKILCAVFWDSRGTIFEKYLVWLNRDSGLILRYTLEASYTLIIKLTRTRKNVGEARSVWVVLQKLPQLSDTHFSQVLNELEKFFFHGFIKYHLALHFI